MSIYGSVLPGARHIARLSAGLSQRVLKLREQYPRWGKDKLRVLLRTEGVEVLTPMVGRILADLKRRGVLIGPLANFISVRKRQHHRPYAVRKPKSVT